jgi:hypothetical protein
MTTRVINFVRWLGFDPRPDEIADILWLAQELAVRQPATSPLITQAGGAISDEREATKLDSSVSAGQNQSKSVTTSGEGEQQAVAAAQVHLSTSQINESATESPLRGIPFRSATTTALPNPLAIGRALRPLKRRVASRHEFAFDEEATIRRLAEEHIALPVQRPLSERWLDLALVVEEGPGMAIWHQTIVELRRLLEHQGAFRNVLVYGFEPDGQDQIILYNDLAHVNRRRRRCHYRELVDPSEQRLILLVSQCVSAAWRQGELIRWLADWSRHAPLGIVQMLPETLWPQSALGSALPVDLLNRIPGAPNIRLDVRLPWFWPMERPDGIAVPVTVLEPAHLLAWAQAVAGNSAAWIPGYSSLPSY